MASSLRVSLLFSLSEFCLLFYHPLPMPLCFKKKKSFPLLNQSGKSLLTECTWAGLDRCVVSRKTGASFLGSVFLYSSRLQASGTKGFVNLWWFSLTGLSG